MKRLRIAFLLMLFATSAVAPAQKVFSVQCEYRQEVRRHRMSDEQDLECLVMPTSFWDKF